MVLKITVKTLDSQNYKFEADDHWTVQQFKDHIESTVSAPASEQRLIYCGRVLLNDKKLLDLDCNERVFHLVQKAPPPELAHPFQFRRTRIPEMGSSAEFNTPEPTSNQPSAHEQEMQSDIDTPIFQQNPVTIDFTEAATWCSISYHEYDHRFAERFQPGSFSFFVDGQNNENSSDRFCVGRLINDNRTPEAEFVRKQMKEGFKLAYINGDVILENLSGSPIFVGTKVTEPETPPSAETVLRVEPGESVKAFADSIFSQMLAKAIPNGFETVYKLTGCSFLHVSFLKGWGGKYKRSTMAQVPCWLEVQLNGPLQWIDQVLRQMRPPLVGGDSTS